MGNPARSWLGGIALAVTVFGCGGDDTAPPLACPGPGVTGTVSDDSGNPLADARVTVAVGAGYFGTRSDAQGRFEVSQLVTGTAYTVGASVRDRAYVEREIVASEPCAHVELALPAETHLGSWDNLGDPGEPFGGTNSAVLLPDGRVMMCHDTRDPVLFDPVARTSEPALASPGLQGCHAVVVMPSGRVTYVGGTNVDVFGPGTQTVKNYDPVADRWEVQPSMNGYRWYPTMTTLPDGRLLAIGGGNELNPQRSKTAEVMDPTTMMWTPVGDVALGNEISPILVLRSGDVLMTHRPPQLFSQATLTWRSAMDFVQGPRMPNGDHADHELQMLPDGRVAAIGYKSFTAGQVGRILEIYDPATGSWSLGAESKPVRSRASTVMMPDGRILVIGGYVEDASDPAPRNAYGYTSLVDVWDPGRDAWRRLTSIEVAREYHAMPVVLPDGRIFVAGGEGQPGNEPAASVAEVFSPPYLARGPRPRIGMITETDLRRGGSLTIDLASDEQVTEVVMMGTNATTHFMDSGTGRYESLAFEQIGLHVTARVPGEPGRAIPGWYLVFVLVDDVPSVARIMRLTR
ncbi:MAG: DUF1929 domain-containing protein [Deltaproteobacteria bacterium]|nr:DUF1929 domain-containing protein [Deltaproteobacteria bacterium]